MDIKERFYQKLQESREQLNEITEFDPDKMSKKEKKNYMKNVPRWGDDESKKPIKKRKEKLYEKCAKMGR